MLVDLTEKVSTMRGQLAVHRVAVLKAKAARDLAEQRFEAVRNVAEMQAQIQRARHDIVWAALAEEEAVRGAGVPPVWLARTIPSPCPPQVGRDLEAAAADPAAKLAKVAPFEPLKEVRAAR